MTDYYRDQYGATVTLVQTLRTGDTVRRSLSPLDAMTEATVGSDNGGDVVSSHIEFNGLLDSYGGSA